MNVWLYLCVFSLLLLIWFWPYSRHTSWRERSVNRRRRFHAVSIEPCQNACVAVNALKGKRFLASEAKHLPVPGCDNMTACQCRYHHYADRRSGQDRRQAIAAPVSKIEQRHQGNRRKRHVYS